MSNDYKSALIGYTGFVGSNLARSVQFNEVYNSKNIEDIKGKSFNKIVCAGVSAVKWWANQNPDKDRAQINRLLSCISTVNTNSFILFSTVDVYREPRGVTEDDIPNPKGLHFYGKNRLYIEDFVKTNFENHYIIRLPALFAPGLKKNVIYDLIHSNELYNINPKSSFQWYPLRRLAHDMDIIENSNIPLINIAVEPIETEVIRRRYFSTVKIGNKPAAESHYDMHTKYSQLFGLNSNYIIQKEDILSELHRFLSESRGEQL